MGPEQAAQSFQSPLRSSSITPLLLCTPRRRDHRKWCLWAPAHTQRPRLAHWKSASEQEKKAAVTLNNHTERLSRSAWVPFCFMAHLPWTTEEGRPTRRDGRRRVVWRLSTTRPMRDGRLAYFQCARRDRASLEHACLDGAGRERGETRRISTQELSSRTQN